MNVPFLDLKTQYAGMKGDMDAAIQDIIDNTAFVGGAAVAGFEEAFAAYIGTKHCVGVGNGTDALILAFRALGIGPGDEVITAANSFVATSEAITAAGGTVVFVDCEPDYYTIDPAKIEEKITAKTKMIVPVHLYGHAAFMEPIMAIAAKHNLMIVEDCAQAHGATYKGKTVGTFGKAACYSFYPGKNLGAYGDGGAVVTDDEEVEKTVRMLSNHGRTEKYSHAFEAFNSRLDGLQAAVLNVKLKRLRDWTAGRRRVAAAYREKLAGIPGIAIPQEHADAECVYHLFVVRTEKRAALQAFLKEKGIASGIHYPIGLPYLKAYEHLGHTPEEYPVTYGYQDQLLSLPMYAELTDEMIAYVADAVREFAG